MKTVSLGSLVQAKGGGTPSRTVPAYWNGDIPWVSVKDLQGSEIYDTQEHITPEGVSNSATNVYPAGTVVTATRMALGRSAVLQRDMAINQDLKALIFKSKLHSRFLLHFLNAQASEIDRMGKGATVKGITLDDLYSLQIPDYAFEQQKRIADILDKADAIRRKRAQALELTDQFLQSVFLDMVGPRSADYIVWPTMRVEQMAANAPRPMRTGPFGSNLRHSEFVSEGIAVLGIDNAVKNRFAWDERRYITEDKYEDLKSYTVYPRDVIVTIMGTTGRSAVVPEDIPTAISTKHLATITVNPDVCFPEFLSYCIHSHPAVLDQIRAANKGAIMNGLNLGTIRELKLRVPPLELQRAFVEVHARSESQRANILDARSQGESLFSSLTQRAFRGEL